MNTMSEQRPKARRNKKAKASKAKRNEWLVKKGGWGLWEGLNTGLLSLAYLEPSSYISRLLPKLDKTGERG